MQGENFKAQLADFISKKTSCTDVAVEYNLNLFSSGLVNSLLLTEVILFVESLLEKSILSDEFEIDNFATINKIYETYA
jgi:hypothetical protein